MSARLIGTTGLKTTVGDDFVVAIISLPSLLLSALSGTAWGTAVEIPFLHDANSLARLFVVVTVLVIAANAVGVQLGVATSYLDTSSLIGPADRPEYSDARAVIGHRASSTTVEPVILALALRVPLLLLLQVGTEPRAGLTNWMLHAQNDIALATPLVAFTPGDDKLLDTADPSAMADFDADYDTVRGMKVLPLGLRPLAVLAVILFVPFSALALTQVSLTQLLRALASKAF